jgi:hypothetical protein
MRQMPSISTHTAPNIVVNPEIGVIWIDTQDVGGLEEKIF